MIRQDRAPSVHGKWSWEIRRTGPPGRPNFSPATLTIFRLGTPKRALCAPNVIAGLAPANEGGSALIKKSTGAHPPSLLTPC